MLDKYDPRFWSDCSDMGTNERDVIRIGSVLQKLFKNKVVEGLLDHPVYFKERIYTFETTF